MVHSRLWIMGTNPGDLGSDEPRSKPTILMALWHFYFCRERPGFSHSNLGILLWNSCADKFCNKSSIIESEVINCQLYLGLHFTPAWGWEIWRRESCLVQFREWKKFNLFKSHFSKGKDRDNLMNHGVLF